MADGKWIPDLTRAMPIAEAARRVLQARLQVVGQYLPLAMNASEQDTEYVHQLRVGTRRAVVALRLFKNCLPAKEFRTTRRKLRKLRTVAGAARDWDVFLYGVLARKSNSSSLDCLRGFALAQRVEAQRELADHGGASADKLAEWIERVLASLTPPHKECDPQNLGQLADGVIGDFRRDLQDALGKDLDNETHLHKARICGKKLRYAMEIFVDCFAEGFRSRQYPLVEEMQEVLGNVNDCRVALQHLGDIKSALKARLPTMWPDCRAAIAWCIDKQKRRLQREKKRFLTWTETWNSECAAQSPRILASNSDAAAQVEASSTPGQSVAIGNE